MTNNNHPQSLKRVVEVLPAWMEADQAAKELLEQSARRGFPVYVGVPAKAIVIEQELFQRVPTSFVEAATLVPLVSAADRIRKARGEDVMDQPVERPLIRFLELGRKDLQELVLSGQIRLHWFHETAIDADTSGVTVRPQALRCIRPALRADSRMNRAASKLLTALTYNPEHVISITTDDVYVTAADASVLKHEIFRPDGDPHHLFESAQAVFGLYSAARKFALKLGEISRTQAKGDVKKLEELKAEVYGYLETFGDPYKSISAKKHAFRIIDPLTPWGRGASRQGTFAETAAKIEGFYQKYGYENFVSEGLGLIIYIAHWAMEQRAKSRNDERVDAAVTPGRVQQRLKMLNFSGLNEIETIASIILSQQKQPRKTASEKKPGPIRRAMR